MEYYDRESGEAFKNPEHKKIFMKVIDELLKNPNKISERLNLNIEERKIMLGKFIKKFNPKKAREEIYQTLQRDPGIGDITPAEFNYQGESKAEEKRDIPIENPETGELDCRGCSNRSDTAETTQIINDEKIKKDLEIGFDGDILLGLFNVIKPQIFPNKKNPTMKEQEEVFKKCTDLLEEIKESINNQID